MCLVLSLMAVFLFSKLFGIVIAQYVSENIIEKDINNKQC